MNRVMNMVSGDFAFAVGARPDFQALLHYGIKELLYSVAEFRYGSSAIPRRSRSYVKQARFTARLLYEFFPPIREGFLGEKASVVGY